MNIGMNQAGSLARPCWSLHCTTDASLFTAVVNIMEFLTTVINIMEFLTTVINIMEFLTTMINIMEF